jgi:tetratricopeptide (TPR) repeat protein
MIHANGAHPDGAVLSAFTLDASGVFDRDKVSAHVAGCEFCQEGVAVFRELDRALRHAETWGHVTALRKPGDRLAQIQAVRQRVQSEDDAATRLLKPLLNSPLRFRNAKLETKPRCHSAGMVRMLCAAANERHESRPKFSLELAVTACTIAKSLPDTNDSGRRLSMAVALRERANALRYLGKFSEALQSLEYAEKLFDVTPGADEFDLAIVWLLRATVFMKSDRLSEGIGLARDAARVFQEYGDRDRELTTVMVEACCLLLSGQAQDAADAFIRLAELARERSNTRMLASALQNGAAALVNLGQLDRAEGFYTEALVLYDELGVPTEKARTMWALGGVVVARGELEEGAARLNGSRTELMHLGLTNDAAQATLEWAEVRLALNKPEGVAAACREIVVVFNSEGMQRFAREALAVLHEALAKGKATPELVRSIRLFLDQLPANPSQRFALAH